MLTIHASCVAIAGRAVLIEGPSGTGKSDLALRLIDRGGVLVSDDYTDLERDGPRLIARAPARIAGQVEVRGFGIVRLPHVEAAPVALLVRLGAPERLPEPAARDLLGVAVPEMIADSFHASAPIKVELALAQQAEIAS